MSKTPDELKKKIETLAKQVADKRKGGAVSKKDPELRKLLKDLKRSQRRLAVLTPVPLEERQKRLQKQSDIIGKILSDMTKNTKKSTGDARVHSLRKKTKSLNKRLKKVGRLLAKKTAAAAPTPAPVPAPAPAPAAPPAEPPKS